MNIWITKNIKFGYRYTTNKSIRNSIIDYFDNYLLNILSSKGRSNDKFIIVGGLFSNTNPSIIAISDAHKYITKISKIMKVILITTPDDIRQFDGVDYSTLTIFENNNNVEIRTYDKDDFISYNDCVIDIKNDMIKVLDKELPIPSAIQFDDNSHKIGLFVNRVEDNKFTILNNSFSPKHKTYEINDFTDFEKIIINGDIIHLIIDHKLVEENDTKLNVEIFKVDPKSVKYKNKTTQVLENTNNITTFDVKQNIVDAIGEDDGVKNQFNRILTILNK